MIARGDDIHAISEQLFRDLGCDSIATGGILAIGNDQVHVVFLTQGRQKFIDGAAPWFADNVADKEDFHWAQVTVEALGDKAGMAYGIPAAAGCSSGAGSNSTLGKTK